MERTDFVARTAAGIAIATFATRDQALAWWSDPHDGAVRFPGCYLAAETEVRVLRARVIRRDRSHLAPVAPATQAEGIAA